MKTFILFLLANLMLITTPKVQAQSIVTVGVVLNELEGTAENILNDAQYVMDTAITNAAVNVLNAIDQFEKAYEDILDKTSDELTEQQQRAFDGLERNIELVFLRIKERQDHLDDSVNSLALHLASVLPGAKIPIITKFSSPIVVEGDENQVTIRFDGILLNNKDNVLVIGDKNFGPSEHSDKTLQYVIPSESFNLGEKEKNESALLSVTLITKYKQFFFFEQIKEYKYLIRIIPNEIATAYVTHLCSETRRDTRQRREQWTVSSRSRVRTFPPEIERGDVTRAFIAHPSPDYDIDINSVNVGHSGNDSCSEHHSRVQLDNRTASAVSISCKSVTHREPGVNCHRTCWVSFTEYQDVETKKEEVLSPVKVSFDKPVLYPLPDESHGLSSIVVELFNGQELVFDKPGRQGFIEVTQNEVSKSVTIRAIRP